MPSQEKPDSMPSESERSASMMSPAELAEHRAALPVDKEREALLPCPFCGGEPIEQVYEKPAHTFANLPDYPGAWSVECPRCEFQLFSHESKVAARGKWAARASVVQEPQVQQAPEGWQLVPKVPTDAMLKAGEQGVDDCFSGPYSGKDTPFERSVEACYRAMLKAAPALAAAPAAEQPKREAHDAEARYDESKDGGDLDWYMKVKDFAARIRTKLKETT
jgi:hypothetical protein